MMGLRPVSLPAHMRAAKVRGIEGKKKWKGKKWPGKAKLAGFFGRGGQMAWARGLWMGRGGFGWGVQADGARGLGWGRGTPVFDGGTGDFRGSDGGMRYMAFLLSIGLFPLVLPA